jgi:hypothetical protein
MHKLFIGCVFIYTLACGLFTQFAVLPHLIPTMDDGNGLLKGSDAVDFHQAASGQARDIREYGWTTWRLRPSGHSPAGIASAMYVLLGHDKPWCILPVYAALWSFSAWILFLIFRPLTSTDLHAFLAVLPFVLAPSSLLFLTQIHKDPFVIAGILILWMALSRLSHIIHSADQQRQVPRILAWISLGLILAWIGRPYTMYLSLLGFAIVVLVILVTDIVKQRINWSGWAIVSFSIFLCLEMGNTNDSTAYSTVGLNSPTGFVFHSSNFPVLDKPFQRMASARSTFLTGYPEARSKLDKEIKLDSVFNVILYIPRSLQILMFSPFPSHWIGLKNSNVLFAALYFETAARYILFPGFFWLCWQKRKTLSFWVPWFYFLPWGIIYTIMTPNLGTLARVRFPLVMMQASLGLIGTIKWFESRSAPKMLHISQP